MDEHDSNPKEYKSAKALLKDTEPSVRMTIATIAVEMAKGMDDEAAFKRMVNGGLKRWARFSKEKNGEDLEKSLYALYCTCLAMLSVACVKEARATLEALTDEDGNISIPIKHMMRRCGCEPDEEDEEGEKEGEGGFAE